MRTRYYTAAYVALGSAALAVEYAALRDPDKGDTITEHVRALVKRPVVWWPCVGLFAWAFLHFFFGRK